MRYLAQKNLDDPRQSFIAHQSPFSPIAVLADLVLSKESNRHNAAFIKRTALKKRSEISVPHPAKLFHHQLHRQFEEIE